MGCKILITVIDRVVLASHTQPAGKPIHPERSFTIYATKQLPRIQPNLNSTP
jgi:hypothetical protein